MLPNQSTERLLEDTRYSVCNSIYSMIHCNHDMPQTGYNVFVDGLQNNHYRAVWQNKKYGIVILATLEDVTQPEYPVVLEIMRKA